MRILPTRTMQLGGRRVEAGTPAEVPSPDAELALRHGWATALPPLASPASPAEGPAAAPAPEAPKKPRAAKAAR